jgi:hypothetical protein
LEEEGNLGMNTMKSSSKALLSYHLYSSAYELEYNCLVIIKIYELAYSLCVMILTCSTLCLIIHMTCMGRSRARVDVTVCHFFGFAHILAFRFVGSESRGDMGSFLIHGSGARVHGNLRI